MHDEQYRNNRKTGNVHRSGPLPAHIHIVRIAGVGLFVSFPGKNAQKREPKIKCEQMQANEEAKHGWTNLREPEKKL